MTRQRWPGFHIGDSDRDRAVSAWLDQAVDDPNMNVSEIVKDYLYQVCTGRVSPDPVVQKLWERLGALESELADLRAMLASGARLAAPLAAPPDDAEEIERRLGGMPD